MALSGSFNKYPTGSFGLYCEWSATQSKSGNYSDVTMDVYLSYYTISVGSRTSATVSINGEEETYSTPSISKSSASSWTKKLLKTYTVRVKHNANGKKTGVKLSASYPFNGTYSGVSINTITASTTIDLDPITVYSLDISAGTGSSITVNRTSSGYGATGNLSDGATLYYNDKLKITFTPSTNYAITTRTVNGTIFTSGNTHTVSGDVSVVAAAAPQKSLIAATDANIGSTSTITVTRYNSSYTHTITYKFGDATGTVCTKSSNVSIAWTVPTSFYAQIPSATSGKCTLTITTYNGSTSLGSNTCTMTAKASSDYCAPSVSGTVVDTNPTTVALTGDSSVLIRYKSTAECTLTATPKNSATISSTTIRGSAPTSSTTLDGVVTAKKSYSSTSYTSYVFAAMDSRGYKTTVTVSPSVVKYIKLTCNPVITRPTPTGSSIVMSISGAFYRGSFGAASNTLTLQYRYRSSETSTYGSWQTISASNVATGTSSYSVASFSLGEEFDYKTSYVFQVRAADGTADYTLTTVTKTITVQRGIPVFDWGENDFSVNVLLRLAESIEIAKHVYLGKSDYTMETGVSVPWADEALHWLIYRLGDGLTSGIGWPGTAGATTTTVIRGNTVQCQNASGTTVLSDERMKKDFTDLAPWTAFFDALEPCAFKMKLGSSDRYHLGFKAQQVAEALNAAGLTSKDFAGYVEMKYHPAEDDPVGSAIYEEAGIQPGGCQYGLIYPEFTALNTYVIQLLQEKVESMSKEIDGLKLQIAEYNIGN